MPRGPGEQNVGRLEVPVDDALTMRGAQGIGDLGPQFQHLVQGQRTLDWLTLDVLHHQAIGAHVVERADVRMIQSGDGTGFAPETVGKPFRAHFDRDVAAEPGVARFPDLAHAASTSPPNDLVWAEALSRGQPLFPRRVVEDRAVRQLEEKE